MAEAIARHGTVRVREASNVSDAMMREIIEEKQPPVALPKEDEEAAAAPGGFELNLTGLTSEEAARRLEKYGRNELPERVTPKWKLFLLQFRAPMPVMIWAAIVIELAIENWIDVGILLAIQLTNASISFYEMNKAGNAVAALKSSLKPSATCKRDGRWAVVDAGTLVPGDLVKLAPGSGEYSLSCVTR